MAVAKAAISLLLLTLLNRTIVVDICRTPLVQLKQSTRSDQLCPVVTHVRVKTQDTKRSGSFRKSTNKSENELTE